jgi:hypothetical protein
MKAAPAVTTKAINKTVSMTLFSTFRHEIHKGSTGHSGQQNLGFNLKRYY